MQNDQENAPVDRKELARRKVVRAADLADIRIPVLSAELESYQSIIAQFAHKRGVELSNVAELRESIGAVHEAIAQHHRDAWNLRPNARQRLDDAKSEIQRIIEGDQKGQGLLRVAILGYSPSPEARALIALQEEIVREAEDVLKTQPVYPDRPQLPEELAFAQAFDRAQDLADLIARHERAKQRLRQLDEAKVRAEHREQRRNALVAAFLEKTRDLADQIRAQLIDQLADCPCCPYCDGDYGNQPRADHIYPVSKGGLSTVRNMLMVCFSCNSKKSDMTLREFILQQNLDRTHIEQTLERLGKTF